MYRETEEEDGILIVALGGKVVGIERESGSEVWRNTLPGGGFGIVELHVDEKVVLALVGGNLFCLDRKTGVTQWTTNVSGGGRGTMLVVGEHIYIACSGELTCLRRDGGERWHTPLPNMGLGSAALAVPGLVRQADAIGSS